ncbi:MAG: aminotransferase class V-fold PLP-dependent enzyme [Ruminococcaceae bacterium]|nr:aminotransferase class V-fold PLP-dependent enzyme [Oscillospiraceae bacterium]
MKSKVLRGEVWTNTHPEIMEELMRINELEVDGKVGHDCYTKSATELMQKNFKDEIKVVYTSNGTAANIMAMKSMVDRWGTILCENHTHIHTYECGAFESMLGNKILAMEGKMGKLTPEVIGDYLNKIKNYKYLPQVVVITQPTELGVLYTNKEIKAICDFAHERDMYVYIDGARISNALVALDTSIAEMIEETGVDAFSFGGTKAGAMFGEMVIFRRAEHFTALEYLQKQALQHLDKSKFLGVQMEYLLKNEFWKKTASHANSQAKYLESKLIEKGIKIYYPVDTNAVFCILNEEQMNKANEKYDLSYWEKEIRLTRMVTTFATKREDVDELLSLI